MATKEPWNNEIYQAMRENPDELKRQTRAKNENKRPLTTRFLTFLVVVMVILIGSGIAFILWNNQQSNNKSVSTSFASSASSAVKSSVSSTVVSSSTATSQTSTASTSSSSTSSSSAAAGSTYTIVAGDTPNAIASKTGLSWSQIASLNNISASGYNADGSAIYPGQVLKLK